MVEMKRLGTKTASAKSPLLGVSASLLLALAQFLLPKRQMPIDYHLVLWMSLPVCVLWLALCIVLLYRFGAKSLWTLLGLPLILYWPFWLVVHGIPNCYWHHNCI